MGPAEILRDAKARKVLRVLEHHAKDVKYRQTGRDPKTNGYEYVEIPLWSVRQLIDELRSATPAEQEGARDVRP